MKEQMSLLQSAREAVLPRIQRPRLAETVRPVVTVQSLVRKGNEGDHRRRHEHNVVSNIPLPIPLFLALYFDTNGSIPLVLYSRKLTTDTIFP